MQFASRWADAVLANDDDPDTESGLACAQAYDALKDAIAIAIDRGARRQSVLLVCRCGHDRANHHKGATGEYCRQVVVMRTRPCDCFDFMEPEVHTP